MKPGEWVEQAWALHGDDAAGVAARLEPEALPLLQAAGADADLAALAQLAHHVHGAHLARWLEGQSLLARLAALPFCSERSAALLRRLHASLALAAGEPGARAALMPVERAGTAALAAVALAEHDAPRAAGLLREAAAETDTLALPDTDPALRAIAVAGNNTAAALQDKAARSAAETALMLEAAALARRFWARAGGWLEVERAEYRLAVCHAAAGDGATARGHARQCLRIVAEQGDDALEAFFGHEALARAEHAAGDAAARAAAVQAAAAAWARIAESDRGGCEATLAQLRAL